MNSWTSFEDCFFRKAFFLGEVQLDAVLKSLLHLDEVCVEYKLPDGRTLLFEPGSIRRKIFSTGNREIKNRYKLLANRKGFDPIKFLVMNDIPLDKICGIFPMVFTNYRLVAHTLRITWAFYLTMRMKKLHKLEFGQRIRGKTFILKSGNQLTAIFIHIHSHLQELTVDEKSIIKCLKNSLCYHVSLSLNQDELPEGTSFDLVPDPFRNFFKGLEKSEKINFFFSLLQSKALCKEVPESFILDTLIKHRDQLSQPPPVNLSMETLKILRERGRKFGRRVAKLYKPNHGFQPTNKASFAFPRISGGLKGDLVYNGCLKNNQSPLSSDPSDRMEPMVIGLFGQPGQGKSSIIPEILGNLKTLFPGVKRENLTYSRTCNTDHWDGYCGQPIVILDDLGQALSGEDIKEFQTLVSCNPYVPPMADLSEKGIFFNSPIIIATSNLQYGHRLSCLYTDSSGILDDASFWRRFHVPLYVENNRVFKLKIEPNWVRSENLLSAVKSLNQTTGIDLSREYYQRETEFSKVIRNSMGTVLAKDLFEEVPSNFWDHLLVKFRSRVKFHDNIRQTWTQVIDSHVETPETQIGLEYYEKEILPHLPTSLGFDASPEIRSCNHSLEFSAFPPSGPLPVRVEPISEPLKVRTITAGKGETFCLKPLQRAMWLALDGEEQFCLTHGTNNLESGIRRIYSRSETDDVWISGDYTAATDSIPLEASKALLEGILESIDHEPTKRWAMKEISPHLLVYPPDSGIEPAIQRSGQLMGSLLSFPLLCLLNDCTAQAIGLKSHQYLINGDDILMRTQRKNYPLWKSVVQSFGLSLSQGKNYVHSEYGTINSQLIFRDELTDSGKQKVLDRRSRILGECLRDLEIMMKETPTQEVHEMFKFVNRQKLSRTVRSICVPCSHGGLALNWGDRSDLGDRTKRTEILVYLNDLFRKIEPNSGCLSIPYLSNRKLIQKSVQEMDESFNDPVSISEYHEDFIGVSQLEKTRKRLQTHSVLRDLFLGQNIENLPALTFLDTVQVPFKDVKIRKELQVAIDKTFLSSFLNSNREFGYESFRTQFIHAVRGINEASKVATEFLVPIIDMDVKPDYLLLVGQDYKVQSFDSELFERKLGKALHPKEFNLPLNVESPDFSQEVQESFETVIEAIISQNLGLGFC